MRSFPPPIPSLSPYSSSDHCTEKAELAEGLVERRQMTVTFGVGEDAVAVEDQRWDGSGLIGATMVADVVGSPKVRGFGSVAGIALAAVISALAVSGAGSSASLPSLYVNYTANCHFTMSLDSGAALTAGTAIPYGTYQAVLSTPFALSTGQGACESIAFQLTGPGVNYSSSLTQGESSQEIAPVILQANATYTASDTSVSPGTTLTFSTSGVAASQGASAGSSSGTGTTTGSKSSSSVLGGQTSSAKVLGTLTGTVNVAGKLGLTYKGKSVTTLPAGSYTVTITDKSGASGFVLRSSKAAKTVTTAAFKGKKSLVVKLAAGQWYFYAKTGATKTYFVATG